MPVNQFLIFFLLLLTGFLCKRFKVFTDAAINGVNTFIISVAYPCLILVRTTVLDMDHSIFPNFLLALFANIGLLLVFGAYARLYCRGKRFDGIDRPAAELSLMSPNNGFMGFPVAITFFGDLGLLYMVACNIALNSVFFTYGIALMKRGRGIPGEPLRKKVSKFLLMIAHQKVSAAIAGVILCYNHIRLPGVFEDFLSGVGATATPLAMISIGTMLAGGFGLHTFKKRAIMEIVLNKLFVVPAIAAAVVWFLPVDPLVKTILIISNVLPVATMAPIFCEQYGRDKKLAGEALAVATLISMITIPAAIWLIRIRGF